MQNLDESDRWKQAYLLVKHETWASLPPSLSHLEVVWLEIRGDGQFFKGIEARRYGTKAKKFKIEKLRRPLSYESWK